MSRSAGALLALLACLAGAAAAGTGRSPLGTALKARAASVTPIRLSSSNGPTAAVAYGTTVSSRSKHPYITIPWWVRSDGTWFKCGATLVSPRIVIIAAHCLDDDWGAPTYVTIGMLSWNDPAGSFQKIAVLNATKHASYNPNTLDFDIGVITLKYAANIVKNPPAVLPAASLSLESKKVTVAGYGTTESGSIARVLKEASLPYINKKTCQTNAKSTYYLNIPVTNRMMCAGDSGGPLIFQANSTAPKQLVGVVSWGISADCGQSPFGAYTDMRVLKQWVCCKAKSLLTTGACSDVKTTTC
ncbi:Transmembrane protease serine [Chlorella sorokiniana]|uniref:Transmembrane protease serine n=1 Tax=Chlorella sorokiniana TaxID=3076 RepID=A0A2P6U247_CHLSO|nr:Transmembrane protease serine [Chlorella sorokiniana]|eukprot:PRW60387.1 Transmembrane protease serine [Chlorella sorokiniana]